MYRVKRSHSQGKDILPFSVVQPCLLKQIVSTVWSDILPSSEDVCLAVSSFQEEGSKKRTGSQCFEAKDREAAVTSRLVLVEKRLYFGKDKTAYVSPPSWDKLPRISISGFWVCVLFCDVLPSNRTVSRFWCCIFLGTVKKPPKCAHPPVNLLLLSMLFRELSDPYPTLSSTQNVS